MFKEDKNLLLLVTNKIFSNFVVKEPESMKYNFNNIHNNSVNLLKTLLFQSLSSDDCYKFGRTIINTYLYNYMEFDDQMHIFNIKSLIQSLISLGYNIWKKELPIINRLLSQCDTTNVNNVIC